MSTPWDRALVKFQSGDFDGARALLEKAVAQAEKIRGVDHPDFADACARLAELCAALEEPEAAIAAQRRAAAARLPGPPGRRDHCAHLLKLGELLREDGQLDEALATQRQGLEARATHFGEGHPQHAFGQIALAEVLIDQQHVPEALPLLEAALQTLWTHGHPAVARAIALRGLGIKVAEGNAVEALGPLGALPPEVFADAVQQALSLVGRAQPRAVLALLQELEGRVSERHPAALRDLYAALAEAAHQAGDAFARLAALIELEALAPHPADRVEVMLAQATTQAEVGAIDTETTFARALAQAELLDHPELLITARRLAGDWLTRQTRTAEARPLLESAVALARSENLWDALARALISWGIFLGTDPAAREALQEGLARLPPGDPQAAEAEAALAALGEEADGEDDGAGEDGEAGTGEGGAGEDDLEIIIEEEPG